MSEVKTIISRYPMHELAFRRLYAADPEFKLVCEDYAAATAAHEQWKDDVVRAEEYRQIIKELEDEVLEYLEMHQPIRGQSTKQ